MAIASYESNVLSERSPEFIEGRSESKETMYYFYILRCVDNSLYCGQTNNLERRLKEQNSTGSKSVKYTKVRQPVKLVYFEKFPTLQLAMKREWQVKKWTKAKKEALIQGNTQLLKKL